MNPNNQQFSPGQYDFITNPGQSSKQPMLGGSTKSRILLVVGGLFILLMVFWIVMSIMSSGKQSVEDNLKSLVAEQEEIIRVAKLGSGSSMSSDVRGFAVSTELSTRTSQQEIIGLLQKSKIKLGDEEIKAKVNSKTDKLLEGASANNRYDETFMDTMAELLVNYKKNLKTLYESIESEEAKAVLEKAYSSTDNLVTKAESGPVSAPLSSPTDQPAQ